MKFRKKVCNFIKKERDSKPVYHTIENIYENKIL